MASSYGEERLVEAVFMLGFMEVKDGSRNLIPKSAEHKTAILDHILVFFIFMG
jgi:hypothetical protein